MLNTLLDCSAPIAVTTPNLIYVQCQIVKGLYRLLVNGRSLNLLYSYIGTERYILHVYKYATQLLQLHAN